MSYKTSSAGHGGPEGTRAGQVGLITSDPGPTLLALLAQTDVDFLILDAEQTGLSVRDCAAVVQGLAGSRVQVGVRVPNLAPETLVAFANTGVSEMVLPQVRSVAQLQQAYEATRYAPEGRRPRQVSPASAFGTDFSCPPRLTVLFETVEALDKVQEFAALDIFDGGWVGPTDLQDELRRHGRTAPDALNDAVYKLVSALTQAGHSVGLPAPGFSAVPDVLAGGADRCAIYWERELAAMLTEFVARRPAVLTTSSI
ncbi:aldolase/citrate lyase family protein [Arthrobacter crystallopoietes]|uniref:2-keto-3-deoxy-L-rhamnonate aldolase RhmA n=1 Tax=Crystallibacter crystallopoietes TaxID=37928 RepID=A0A1H1CWN4_9MICC|nr:aldolase/citrate lyase family protein [Arthrobacter crystallopoietes]AUI50570.1 hypothetical protein AC20117_06740 [Arthrobacter crystallopoietes]SDQ68634.1 2-keto-3-deoxy-L-rhamnonate aldolase RhmA [Arthrobacter crystallopoietes]